jgi:hypothetical protein
MPFIGALFMGGIIGRTKKLSKIFLVFLSGMLINFIDLLTSPILFFGIVVFAFLVPICGKGKLTTLKHFIYGLTAWFSGYFGAWLVRFYYAENFGQTGQFSKALEQAFLRTKGVAFNDVNQSIFFPSSKILINS